MESFFKSIERLTTFWTGNSVIVKASSSPKLFELPELIIWLVTNYLSYEDIRNLRVTCKQLKEIVDQRTFTSLHLFVEHYPFQRELLHTGELVDYGNTFHVHEPTILKSIKFKSQFTELRKLSIYHMRYPPWNEYKVVDLNDLNYFEQLVHLELIGVAIQNSCLRLPSLRIAFLENTNSDTTFELDCPRLKVLGLGFWITEFRTTSNTNDSITHLYIQSTTNIGTFLFLLYAKLQNLSTICFIRELSSESLNDFVVALIERRVQLPLLKRIGLRETFGFPESGILLQNLIKLQSRYETRHIEVQVNGKVMDSNALAELLNLLGQISPDDQFNFARLEGDMIRQFSEKRALKCLLPGVGELELTKEDFPMAKRLIVKLRNLKYFGMDEESERNEQFVLDEELFECFLKTCRGTEFILPCDFLTQQQLDLIPNYLQNLKCLRFNRDAWQSNLSFNFVSKLKNLYEISFRFNIPKKAMSFLLKDCTFHVSFNLAFYGMMQNIWIFKQPNNGRIEVICGSKLVGDDWYYPENKIAQLDDIDDAIEHYYRNDLFNTPWTMPPQDS